jgi:SSS family solute:Na+ symporter
MNLLDYFISMGALVGIAAYGMWHTRGRRNLSTYLKGKANTGWAGIGISVLATQASAITFLSMPGQGYENGLGFVQNYFGMPLALIIVSVFFLPMYRKFNVYTAYEYLGHRFDSKTRLLGAGLFLIQRGLAAGITIYAPAIILSAVLGWRLDLTIVLSGVLAIAYTLSGGSETVTVTQKYQMTLITGGMITALIVLIVKLPGDVSLVDALTVAGGLHKMQAVDFSVDPHRRYTFWSGLLGGLFLSLSYFGADQSQVQRYISGTSLRESRLGLMFNAVIKIPMQFFILVLGVLLFVFYQFERPPMIFNESTLRNQLSASPVVREKLKSLEKEFEQVHIKKEESIRKWLSAKNTGHDLEESAARAETLLALDRSDALRTQSKTILHSAEPAVKDNDSDYVFITFVLHYLPHGAIGILIATIFAAALGSKASELNALAGTTTVDIYRHLCRKESTDAHYVAASKWFTLFWGIVAISFALFANLLSDMIEAVNILGSIFYGVALSLFIVALFLKRIGGTAVFYAALVAQVLVFVLYFTLSISYLWYNLIGCAVCVVLSIIFQTLLGRPSKQDGVGLKL